MTGSEGRTFTITGLLMNFRDSLRALIPILEAQGHPVGREKGYDAWDEITQVLFKHLVIENIRWSLNENEMTELRLVPYEGEPRTYSGVSFIFTKTGSGRSAFSHFDTTDSKLSRVILIDIDAAGNPVGPRAVDIQGLEFHCALQIMGREASVDSIETRL